jgi:hypothetical protein
MPWPRLLYPFSARLIHPRLSDKRGGFCRSESLTSLPNGVRPNPLYGKNPFLDGASTPQFQIGLLINGRIAWSLNIVAK